MTRKRNLLILIILLLNITLLSNSACTEIPEDEFSEKFTQSATELDPIKRAEALNSLLERSSNYQRFIVLPKAAKTAIELNRFTIAEEYANELLSLADEFKSDWNYGNAIHDANIVFGMISLNKNLVDEAKKYLIKAGKAPTSPQLKTFGPSMILANALLEKGEKEVVIQYLQLLKNIWERDDGRLESWIASVRGGGMPHFGANLHR